MSLVRTSVALLLIAGVSGAAPLLAESAGQVSGHAVDAGGRPLPMLRVELLEVRGSQSIGVPVQVKLTNGSGAWSFSSVPAGDYIVRMVYGDQTTGVPVSVGDAAGVTDVLIVGPSLRAPNRSMQPGAAAGAAAAGGWTTGTFVAAAVAAGAFTSLVVLHDES